MPNSKKLLQAAAGTAAGAGVTPEGTMFNGVDDYISRTCLTGSSNGRQFTFSFWAYLSDNSGYVYTTRHSTQGQVFYILNNGEGRLTFRGENTSYSGIIDFYTEYLPVYKWFHIVVSVDLRLKVWPVAL